MTGDQPPARASDCLNVRRTEKTARLGFGETLGDRVLKVDHAGEHGAVNIYRGQLTACRYRDPALRRKLDDSDAMKSLIATYLPKSFSAEGSCYGSSP